MNETATTSAMGHIPPRNTKAPPSSTSTSLSLTMSSTLKKLKCYCCEPLPLEKSIQSILIIYLIWTFIYVLATEIRLFFVKSLVLSVTTLIVQSIFFLGFTCGLVGFLKKSFELYLISPITFTALAFWDLTIIFLSLLQLLYPIPFGLLNDYSKTDILYILELLLYFGDFLFALYFAIKYWSNLNTVKVLFMNMQNQHPV